MKPPAIKPTSAIKRFFNWFIDVIVVSIIVNALLAFPYILGLFPEAFIGSLTLLGVILQLILMEYLFDASLGKLITNTRVVSSDGTKPYLRQIILRALVRLIPFEPISYFSSNPVGWHDSYTNTLVIEKTRFDELKTELEIGKRPNIGKIKYVPTIIFLSIVAMAVFVFPNYFKWRLSSVLSQTSLQDYMDTMDKINNDQEPDTKTNTQNDWQAYFLHQDKFEVSLPTSPSQILVELPIKGAKLELDVYESTSSGGLFQAGYADIDLLLDQKYRNVEKPISDSGDNPALADLQKQRAKRLSEVDIDATLAKEDIYQALFTQWPGSREIVKTSDAFNGNNSYDFLWKNSQRGSYIKGKIIIVNSVDLFILLNENTEDDFPNFEQFIYSWHSYGNLSE